MARQRRNFDPSFKLAAVRMITEQALSISHVCQTMDIGVTAIRRRMEQYEAEQLAWLRLQHVPRRQLLE